MVHVFIAAEHIDALRAAITAARAKPITWDVLSKHIPKNQETATLMREDKHDPNWRPQSEVVEFEASPGHVMRINVSFEEQPAGLLAHFSMSLSDRIPNPIIVEALLSQCGYVLGDAARVWQEEFMVDRITTGNAINILFMAEARGLN
jgi:hypothetical protein